MQCPGSVVLEAAYPDTSSVYANEGTLAHELGAGALKEDWNLDLYVGESWTFEDGTGCVIGQEIVDYAKAYAARVKLDAKGHILQVEERVPIGHITGEDDAYGTADVVVIKPGELVVRDLKYGMGVQVFAKDNEQLMLYAAGALAEFDMLYDFDKVTMVIDQPRLNHLDEHTVTVAEMVDFIGRAAEAARRVAVAVKEKAAGWLPDTWQADYLQPGEKQCRFCKAKATCPALRAEAREFTGAAATAEDFAGLVEDLSDAGDNYLSVAMSRVGMIEDYCKALRAETERRLLSNIDVPGWKLVQGKRGARQWTDDNAAEARLKAMRLKVDEMYSRKVISPTQAEKVLKPAQYTRIKDLVTQGEGKLSVAPATDPRPAKAAAATAEDFRELIGEEL